MDKRHTRIVKGIAILFLVIFHYRFWAYRIPDMGYFPLTKGTAEIFAGFGNVCVAIFAFLSGYGLSASYEKNRDRLFSFYRLLKLEMNIWVMWLAIACSFIVSGTRLSEIFVDERLSYRIFDMVMGFFGLSYRFAQNSLNGDWWYLVLAIAFILITPLFVTICDKIGSSYIIGLILIYLVFFGNFSYLYFICPYLFGVAFYKENLFARIKAFSPTKSAAVNESLKLVAYTILFIIFFIVRHYIVNQPIADLFLPPLFCLIVIEAISYIPILNTVLEFIGKHSMNIYLLHSLWLAFLFKYNFFSNNFFIAYIIVFIICLASSVLFEFAKKITGYNSLIKKLTTPKQTQKTETATSM